MKPELKVYILDRLKEPSTWRGIVKVATALASIFGIYISLTPEQVLSIIATGTALAGIIGAATKDSVTK